MPKSKRGTGARIPRRTRTSPGTGNSTGGNGRPERPGSSGSNSPKHQQTTLTLSYTGARQTWIAPTGVTSVTVTARGAQGGPAGAFAGGLGGEVKATVPVTPLTAYDVYIGGIGADQGGGGAGGGGFNGGGNAYRCPSTSATCGGGGGGTDLRTGGGTYSDRLIVGAGGGGNGNNVSGAAGGVGGASTGGTGTVVVGGAGGLGGTQAAGGASVGADSGAGALGAGGAGNGTNCGQGGRGGGGGGYYGGSSGSTGGPDASYGAGGGGGSNGIPGAGVTLISSTAGVRTGNGQMLITYTPPALTTDSDTFTKADSASSMGSTSKGRTWTPLHATWGISSNQGYMAVATGGFDGSGGAHACIADFSAVSDSSDFDMSIDVTVLSTNNTGAGLTFRASDSLNGWVVFTFRDGVGTPRFYLRKYVGGVVTGLVEALIVSAYITTVRILALGSRIEYFLGGISLGVVTDSFNSTAKKHGVVVHSDSGATTPRFDNWVFSTL